MLELDYRTGLKEEAGMEALPLIVAIMQLAVAVIAIHEMKRR